MEHLLIALSAKTSIFFWIATILWELKRKLRIKNKAYIVSAKRRNWWDRG